MLPTLLINYLRLLLDNLFKLRIFALPVYGVYSLMIIVIVLI